MREPLRIIIVGGHPADVFDHCGGTMAHHIKAGDTVTCLALTQGLRIHDVVISEKLGREGIGDMTPEELDALCKEREKVKYAEVKEACGVFGITDVRFLSYDDKILFVTEELVIKVARIIREIKPDILITHWPYEAGGIGNHHANTGRIVMSASDFAGHADFEDKTPAWKTPQIFFMSPKETHSMTRYIGYMHTPFCPFYVDITDVAELKIKALNCIRSQQYDGIYAVKRTETMEGMYGHNMHVGYAEAFVPNNSEIYNMLPLSDELRERANEPEIAIRNRGSYMVSVDKMLL